MRRRHMVCQLMSDTFVTFMCALLGAHCLNGRRHVQSYVLETHQGVYMGGTSVVKACMQQSMASETGKEKERKAGLRTPSIKKRRHQGTKCCLPPYPGNNAKRKIL